MATIDTKRLRQKLLDLAVRGKLVQQDPNDEPASVLLERIREERHELIKEGKIKAPKGGESVIYRTSDGSHYEKRIDAKGRESEPACIDDEIPFEIPENWEWTRLGSLLKFVSDGTHKTPEYKESGVLFLSVQNISSGAFDLSKVKYISKAEHERLCKRVKPQKGDILFCRIGTLGKPIVVDVDYEFSIFVSLGLLRAIELALNCWIINCINAPLGSDWISRVKVGGGTHASKINLGDVPSFLLPVPPLEEQQRIVTALNKYLGLVDVIENNSTELEKLYVVLRAKVLDLSIRGKLVLQDPNDEPASVLLERIREERHELIKEGKIKAPKGGESIIYRGSDGGYYEKRIDAKGHESEPVCIDEEIPFEIPESWEWCRLGSYLEIERGGSPRPIKAFLTTSESGINWIKIGDADKGGKYISTTKEKIKPEGLRKSRYVVEGDFLLTNSMSFGRPYILKTNGCIHDGWLVIREPEKLFIKDFLYYLLSSRMMFLQFEQKAAGSEVSNLNIDRVKDGLVVVPPLGEQSRIVAKIDELMPLIAN